MNFEPMPTTYNETYSDAARFEHMFWLQILGDHARFIRDGLSPFETREIERAESYQRAFDGLLQHANSGPLSDADWAHISQLARTEAQHFREYKLHLLRRQLRGDIKLNLPPTFLNHMVNEIEEYLRLLESLTTSCVPNPVNPLHHHLLWLSDASGHAAFLDSAFDMVETNMHQKSRQFQADFEHFYIKAVELAGYLRSRMTQFPALSRFHKQVELEMLLFRGFLNEIEEMQLTSDTLDILSPLIPDHMAREECYYLWKLSQLTQVNAPTCNPAQARTE